MNSFRMSRAVLALIGEVAIPPLPAPKQATGPDRVNSKAIYRVSGYGVKPFRPISRKILKNLSIRSGFEDNFADMAAGFHMPVCLGGLVEGQDPVNYRTDRPAVQEWPDVSV